MPLSRDLRIGTGGWLCSCVLACACVRPCVRGCVRVRACACVRARARACVRACVRAYVCVQVLLLNKNGVRCEGASSLAEALKINSTLLLMARRPYCVTLQRYLRGGRRGGG